MNVSQTSTTVLKKSAQFEPMERNVHEAPSMKWLKADLISAAKRIGLYADDSMTKREILEAIWIKARS